MRYSLNFSAHGIVNLRYFPNFKYGWIRLLSSVFPSSILFAAQSVFASPFPIILKQNIFPSLFYSFTTDSILPHIVSSSISARFQSSFLHSIYTSKGFELNVIIFNNKSYLLLITLFTFLHDKPIMNDYFLLIWLNMFYLILMFCFKKKFNDICVMSTHVIIILLSLWVYC